LGLLADDVDESRHESLMGELNNAHDCMVEVTMHVNRLVVPDRLSDIPDDFCDSSKGLELIVYQGAPLSLASRCMSRLVRAIDDDGL
jgi:hypothetical protein